MNFKEILPPPTFDSVDNQFKRVIQEILSYGEKKYNKRRDTYRYEIPNARISFRTEDIMSGFPIITSKKVFWKTILVELLWFLRADTTTAFLDEHGVKIWKKDAEKFYDRKFGYVEHNSVGKAYGYQWRLNNGVDQIFNVIQSMRKDIHGARIILEAWNPHDVVKDAMALPPCHKGFQIVSHTVNDQLGFLMIPQQRASDWFLGVPFNISSYAFLGIFLQEATGYPFFGFDYNFNCVHLYENQLEAARKFLDEPTFDLPTVAFGDTADLTMVERIDTTRLITTDVIRLENYQHGKAFKVEMMA